MLPSPDPALPEALYRVRPEDFVVDELPAYAPSGEGDHLFVRFRKRVLSTPEALSLLAGALGADARDAGAAGMKDRHAVTTQTASFFVGAKEVNESSLASLTSLGLEVLDVSRHPHKLRPGHLAGNRFEIVLRGVPGDAVRGAAARLDAAGSEGVPNAFGPQRFGRDGDNPERALAWLSGRVPGPKDRRLQRLLFSSVQSMLFNEVLARREADGTWQRVLPGDLAKKSDTGGLFDVPAEGPELEDAARRAEAGLVSPTGPMFGAKMRWPALAPRALEEEILASRLGGVRLEAFQKLGEGTRRPLRLLLLEPCVVAEEAGEDGAESGARLRIRFALPKGAYATTVLGRAFRLVDASRRPSPLGRAAGPEDRASEAGGEAGGEEPGETEEGP